MYTALLLWCFVKLTQLKPSPLDPIKVGPEVHASASLSSNGIGGQSLVPNRTLQPHPCHGCVNMGVFYQTIHPILGVPEKSLWLRRKPCHMLTWTDDGARPGLKSGGWTRFHDVR